MSAQSFPFPHTRRDAFRVALQLAGQAKGLADRGPRGLVGWFAHDDGEFEKRATLTPQDKVAMQSRSPFNVALAVGDLDGDGDLDYVFLNRGGFMAWGENPAKN